VRYATEGLAALADRSSKPDRCPHQIAPEIEARIVELRRSHPGWGPRTILGKPRRELEDVPSRSAIYRCLVRPRLIQPRARRRRRDDYKRWERSRSVELWQLDVLGDVFLSNGSGVSVVTGIDDHSRFCVIAKVVARATARPVCDALLEALNTYGIPEQILTDNGKVFTGRLGRKPATTIPDAHDVPVDRDVTMILNNGPLGFTLNGKGFPATAPIVVNQEDTLRIRYMNEGLQVHPMHLAWRSSEGHRQGRPHPADAALGGHRSRRTRTAHRRSGQSNGARHMGVALPHPQSRRERKRHVRDGHRDAGAIVGLDG